MLAAIGDLVEDIVVRLQHDIVAASDTESLIDRRQGGSAANVAVAAIGAGCRARFIGQVGDDHAGAALIERLDTIGVDTSIVPRQGSTGTIIVLVDNDGERSFLTDRRACRELRNPQRSWLDGVEILHVPFYSLAEAPLSETATTLVGWAHEAGIAVSVDASSAAVLDRFGAEASLALIASLNPAFVFANEQEAEVLGLDGAVGSAVTVIKHGAEPTEIHRPGNPALSVEVPPLASVVDTTGAGDAFAAGFLAAIIGGFGPEVAAEAGNRTARAVIGDRQT